MKIIASLKQ